MTPAIKNVLLIVVDTLRARNVGLYRGGHDTTPFIDNLGAKSTVFDRAICTQSGSWISYATMLRGDHVFGFSFVDVEDFHRHAELNRTFKTAYRETPLGQTVTGVLGDNDIESSAITRGNMLHSEWGWDKGFDRYNDDYHTSLQDFVLNYPGGHYPYRAARKISPSRFPPFGMGRADGTTRLAKEELNRLSERDGWFLFLQFTDPHSPLSPYRNAPADWHPYDQEIRRVDDAVAEIVSYLDQLELRDETLLIFTADHGESFGEHAAPRGHGKNIYEETIRVPLLLHHPDLEARRVQQGVARLKDIGPTILGAFDLDPPNSFSGKNLLEVATGDNSIPEHGLFWASGNLSMVDDDSIPDERVGPVVGVHTGRYKYATTPGLDDKYEWLFDLQVDPRETNNIVDSCEVAGYLRDLTQQEITLWEQRCKEVPTGREWEASRSTEQQLRDLGYR